MNRLFFPVFFAVASGFVWYFNGHVTQMKLVFPLIPFVPGYENNASAQGNLTWQMFAGISGLVSMAKLHAWWNEPPNAMPPSA